MPPGGEQLATLSTKNCSERSLWSIPPLWKDAVAVGVGMKTEKMEQGFVPARQVHPALLVNDLDSLASHFSPNGYSPASDAPLDGYRRISLDDPFGNRIEVKQKASF